MSTGQLARAGKRKLGDRATRTRLKLLKAAERLIGLKGFYETSVSEIALKAGVAQGTFYLYFKDKKEIFRELVRHLNHELRKTIQMQVEGLTERKEIERRGFKAFFRFVREHPHLYRVVRESEAVDPSIQRWYYETLASGYAARLKEAMELGQIKKMDAEVLAYSLMGVAHMLGKYWVLWRKREPTEEELDELFKFIYGGISP